MAGGVVVRALFARVWVALPGQYEKPDPIDQTATWSSVLAAAALEGPLFAATLAAMLRTEAAGVEKMTGEWPAPR